MKASLESGFIPGKVIIFNSDSVAPFFSAYQTSIHPVQLEGTVPTRDYLTSDINFKFRRVPKTTLRFDDFLEGLTELTKAISV